MQRCIICQCAEDKELLDAYPYLSSPSIHTRLRETSWKRKQKERKMCRLPDMTRSFHLWPHYSSYSLLHKTHTRSSQSKILTLSPGMGGAGDVLNNSVCREDSQGYSLCIYVFLCMHMGVGACVFGCKSQGAMLDIFLNLLISWDWISQWFCLADWPVSFGDTWLCFHSAGVIGASSGSHDSVASALLPEPAPQSQNFLCVGWLNLTSSSKIASLWHRAYIHSDAAHLILRKA